MQEITVKVITIAQDIEYRGYWIYNWPENGDRKYVDKMSQVAEYIDPRPEPTQYDIAKKTAMEEVANKAKYQSGQAYIGKVPEGAFLSSEPLSPGKPKPLITDEVQLLIDAAVRAGYPGNIARFLQDVQALKDHTNLQDDAK